MIKCPKCHIPLCRIDSSGVGLHVCPDCRGKLIEDDRLAAIQRRDDSQWTAAEKQALCRQADESNTAGRLKCPYCFAEMEKLTYETHTNPQVDHCRECRVYWLDAGELEKIQILHQEEVRHRTPEDWARIEKLGRAYLAMEYRKEETAKEVDEAAGAVGLGVVRPMLDGEILVPVVGLAAGLVGAAMQINRREREIDAEVERIIDGRPAPEPFDVKRLGTMFWFTAIAIIVVALAGIYYLFHPLW